MKLIKLFPLLLIMASCQSSEKKEPEVQNTDQARQLIFEKIKPYFNGSWVNADYIDDVSKTKSPRASSEKIAFYSEFHIDIQNSSTDSINVPAGMGNHEGSEFVLYFRPGQLPGSVLTNITNYDNKPHSYELGPVVNGGDTNLVLYHYDENKKLVDKTNYIKAGKSVRELRGLETLVNEKLLVGSYKGSDTAGRQLTVKFTADGKMNGIEDYKTYFILTDFVAVAHTIPDEVNFETPGGKFASYGFQINGDTLDLFTAPENEDDTLFRRERVYKLVKQH